MKKTTALATLFLICTFSFSQKKEQGNLLIDGIPELPKRITDKLAKYTEIKSSQLADWAPGGEGLLFSTRVGDVAQIHITKTPGNVKQQLTTGIEPVTSAASCPDKKRNLILYMKDNGGN